MRAVFVFLSLVLLSGCARERAGVVARAEGKGAAAKVAGAEVFVVKQEAEAGIFAPAKDAAAAKKKEVDEKFRPELAKLEAALTTAIDAQAKVPPGKTAPKLLPGGDEKRNAAMEALMTKQKELFLARQEARSVGFDALRKSLTQPPAAVTGADGSFKVTTGSDEIVLVLDA